MKVAIYLKIYSYTIWIDIGKGECALFYWFVVFSRLNKKTGMCAEWFIFFIDE